MFYFFYNRSYIKYMDIKAGDLVTLKGMNKISEKPIGLVKSVWMGQKNKNIKIVWLNEELSRRFALSNIMKAKKLEIVSGA
jgi:hypothetical protein